MRERESKIDIREKALENWIHYHALQSGLNLLSLLHSIPPPPVLFFFSVIFSCFFQVHCKTKKDLTFYKQLFNFKFKFIYFKNIKYVDLLLKS